MIEYGHRMAAVWFAGQAGNWDLAQYQLAEMVEIQEVGETTRPARAPALKSFESSFLDPLDEAIKAKDKTRSRAPTTQLSRAATPATVRRPVPTSRRSSNSSKCRYPRTHLRASMPIPRGRCRGRL